MSLPLRRVGIAVVHHGSEAVALEGLASLAAAEGVEMRLAFVDHNLERSAALAERVAALRGEYLWNPSNPGFAAGANAGLDCLCQASTPGYAALAILNADVTLAPDCLLRLVEALEMDPRIGLAGPGLLCREAPGRWWNLGSRIDWPAARPVSLRHGEPRQGGDDGAHDTGFVCGCALVLRPALRENLGGLDESYFLYFEDADYSLRAQAAGWRTVVVPGALAWHRGGAATSARPELAAYCRTRGRLRFSRRWQPRPLLGWAHRATFALHALLRPAWTVLSPRRRTTLAAARAAWDHLRDGAASLPARP